jgi:hypothetical protein
MQDGRGGKRQWMLLRDYLVLSLGLGLAYRVSSSWSIGRLGGILSFTFVASFRFI